MIAQKLIAALVVSSVFLVPSTVGAKRGYCGKCDTSHGCSYCLKILQNLLSEQGSMPETGIVRITAKRRHWPKNVERLCDTELAPLGESGGTVQLEIFAAAEMALLIKMIVYG